MALRTEEWEELALLEEEKELRAFYRRNPLKWIEDILGVDPKGIKWSLYGGNYETHEWDGTEDPLFAALQGIADWRNVAMEAATGVGKTWLSAMLVLWFLDCFPYSKVITVAPKETQLTKNLWSEIGKHWPAFKTRRPNAEMGKLWIRVRPDLEDMEAWSAFGFVCGVGANEDTAQKAKGFHAEHMLIIFEETPGIDDAIMTSFRNTCTAPHNLRLALGNPVGHTDQLHKFAVQPTTLHIRASALDYPNLVLVDQPSKEELLNPEFIRNMPQIISGAASWSSVLERLYDYGEDHVLYKSQVRGICPIGSAYGMFKDSVLANARKSLSEPVEVTFHPEPKFGTGLSDGETRIYTKPDPAWINRYILFADVAGDHGDMDNSGDFHVCTVFDRVERKPAAVIRMQGPRDEYAKEILRVADMYKVFWPERNMQVPPLLAWETNGVGGLTMVPEFREYPNLYFKKSLDVRGAKPRRKYGWYTGVDTRPEMMDELQKWAYELGDKPERVVDEWLLNEASTFVWNSNRKRFEGAPGCHDDCMMSLSGALVIDTTIPKPFNILTKGEYDKEQSRLTLLQQRKRVIEQMRKRERGEERKNNPWDVKIPKTLV